MKNNDWLSALQSLRDTLPDDTADDTTVESEPATATPSIQKERLDIVLDKKGRSGKCATIITGFTIDEADIQALASDLKKRLGRGGSCRGGEILIQGDRRHDVADFLNERGFKARLV